MLEQVRQVRATPAASGRAGAAGASREQFSQSRLSRRPARRMPPFSARCAGRLSSRESPDRRSEQPFDAGDLLREIERAAPDVGIVTLAPEIGRRHRAHWLADEPRPPRLARALRGDLRRGDGGGHGRRQPGHASVQLHAADQSPGARAGRRGAAEPTRSPPSSFATASTCTRPWCAPQSPRSGRTASWRSPTAPRPPVWPTATPLASAISG